MGQRPVAGGSGTVVDHGPIGEVGVQERAPLDDLGLDADGGEHVPQAGRQALAEVVQVAEHLGCEHPEIGDAGRQGDGVPGVRPALVDGVARLRVVKQVHEIGASAESADGQAAADHFAEGGQVRGDVTQALVAAVGDAERDDLVHHEQQVELFSDVPDKAGEVIRNLEGAGLAVVEHCGDLIRVLPEDERDGFRIVVRQDDRVLGGPRHAVPGRHRVRRVCRACLLQRRADAHLQRIVAAVVGALELGDLLPAGGSPDQA